MGYISSIHYQSGLIMEDYSENNLDNHLAKPKARTSWIFEIFHIPQLGNRERVRCESHIEHDFVLKCIFDPKVKYIRSGLDSIQSEELGGRYTPDDQIYHTEDGFVNIDCRSRRFMPEGKAWHKYELLEKEYEYNDGKFKVVLDTEVRDGYLIANLKRLFPYLSMAPPSSEELAIIYNCLDSGSPLPLEVLQKKVSRKGGDIRSILYALAHKLIQTDLTQFINRRSLIRRDSHAVQER